MFFLIRITLSPQIRDKAAGTGAGLCEYISLSQRRLERANRCARICELGTGKRASQRSQIRRHEIQYALVFHGKPPMSQVDLLYFLSSLLCRFSFFFLSFSGSLFSNFPPPYNSDSPRAVSAHWPAGWLIIHAAM